MPYGLEVINDFGSVLINDNMSTMQFKAKYSATIPSGSGPNRSIAINVPNCTNPIFAIRPQAAGGADRWMLLSASLPDGSGNCTVNAWVMSSGGFLGINDTSSFPVHIYHFDIPDPNTGGNFGLKLFNSVGTCTFNSNIVPAYIEASIWEDTTTRPDYEDHPNLLPGAQMVALASGHLGAVVMNGGYWEEYARNAGDFYHFFQTVAKVNGQNVTIWPRCATVDVSPAGAATEHYTGSPGGIVIDVAGL